MVIEDFIWPFNDVATGMFIDTRISSSSLNFFLR